MRTLATWSAAILLFPLGAPPGHAQEAERGGKASAVLASFLVKPYVQLGDAPALSPLESLRLLWHTDDVDAAWSVEYRPSPDQAWTDAEPPVSRRVAVSGIAPHRVYNAALARLKPGALVAYRVRKAGDIVFSAEARARKGLDQPHRFVAFGDCAAGTVGQKAVAYQAYLAHPDYLMIPGDIVYSRGRISEYRERFWPVYNADNASPSTGAPLLRNSLFLAAPGNHDLATRDLEKYPDGLAYFLYWSQPLNGPSGKTGAPHTPTLQGPAANQRAFLDAAGPGYPRMASFAFDYGNVHWTVLDANTYVDWTDPALRAWVERDLVQARNATWRFVCFHQPGFNSSKSHFDEQRMRLMSEVFEQGGVDLVFSGHVHNYQRTYPLRFVPDANARDRIVGNRGRVGGRWTLDKVFDGKRKTKPSGVIYLITGAGGAGLYDVEQQEKPATWQEFTARFRSDRHSLTVVDVDGPALTVRQVSEDGDELDRFVVTRDSRLGGP